MPRSRRSRIIEYALFAVFFILLFIAVFVVGIRTFKVPSRSMVPTLQPGDMLVTGKIREVGGVPSYRDIIVFKEVELDDKGRQVHTYYVKRVIGLPGDIIVILPAQGVYRNGVKLDEPYIEEVPLYRYGPALVPKNGVFVLGDNRNYSADSSLTNEAVPLGMIVGRVIFRYFPFSRFGFVE